MRWELGRWELGIDEELDHRFCLRLDDELDAPIGGQPLTAAD
jgi:hypothetical protein